MQTHANASTAARTNHQDAHDGPLQVGARVEQDMACDHKPGDLGPRRKGITPPQHSVSEQANAGGSEGENPVVATSRNVQGLVVERTKTATAAETSAMARPARDSTNATKALIAWEAHVCSEPDVVPCTRPAPPLRTVRSCHARNARRGAPPRRASVASRFYQAATLCFATQHSPDAPTRQRGSCCFAFSGHGQWCAARPLAHCRPGTRCR